MTTTAIIVEILIVGMQAVVWLIFGVFTLFGYEWVPAVKNFLKGWEGLASIFAIGLCYTLGVFVDRAADCIFLLLRPQALLLRSKWIASRAKVAHSDHRMAVLSKEDRASLFLEYIRSRVRIARASVLNFFLITVLSLSFILIRCRPANGSIQWNIVIFMSIAGMTLTFLATLTLAVLEATYEKRLRQACYPSTDDKAQATSHNND